MATALQKAAEASTPGKMAPHMPGLFLRSRVTNRVGTTTRELVATRASRYDRRVPIPGEYEPSPWKFVADQVALYEATAGVEGGTLQGKPVVILTTRGRHSGKVRKTPLMRVEHNGPYGHAKLGRF